MKSYSAYKHSGVPWLGEIPEHWEIQRIANTFRERKTKVSDKEYPPISVTKQGILPQLEKVAKTDNGDNRKLVREGDFVINSRSDRKGSSGISAYTGSVSLINHVLIPMEGWDRSFLHHLLRSVPFQEEFYQKGHGIVADLWTTRYSDISSSYLPVPPLSEQAAIASYLDKKCGEIDEMVRRRQAIIERLRELKQALIAKAVTKGLQPDVPMKDSGIPWLGEIPEHWEKARFKRFTSLRMGATILATDTSENGIPVYSATRDDSIFGYVKETSVLLHKNDIVIPARGNSIGYVTQIKESVATCTQTTICAQDIHDIDSRYLYFCCIGFQSEWFRYEGSAIPQITVAQVKKCILTFPPLSEQQEIAAYLDKKCAAIDELISRHGQIVEKLKELKASAIAHVVTGKIDIRERA